MNADQQPGPALRHGASAPPGAKPLHPMDWATETESVDEVLDAMNGCLRRRRRRRFGALAGATLAAAIGGFIWQSAPAPRTPLSTTNNSQTIAISQPARETLPDGSIVELKEGARIAIDYNDRFRRVALLQGEAHFQVAKNSQKPFVVVAGTFAVQAVGTAFSVQHRADTVEVLVTEGRVAVDQSNALTTASASPAAATRSSPGSAPAFSATSPSIASASAAALLPIPPPLALLDAGKRLVVGLPTSSSPAPLPVIQALSPAEMSEQLRWRVPRLQFSGTPLEEIIPRMNPHSRVQLALTDPELGKVRLSGTLRADDTDTLLGLLAEGYGIAVDRRSATEFALRKK